MGLTFHFVDSVSSGIVIFLLRVGRLARLHKIHMHVYGAVVLDCLERNEAMLENVDYCSPYFETPSSYSKADGA